MKQQFKKIISLVSVLILCFSFPNSTALSRAEELLSSEYGNAASLSSEAILTDGLGSDELLSDGIMTGELVQAGEDSFESFPEILIMQEPEDATGRVEDKVTFKVVAENVSSYQWQYSKGTDSFLNVEDTEVQENEFELLETEEDSKDKDVIYTGSKTDSLSIIVTSENKEYRWQCVLTDERGNKTFTKSVVIKNPDEIDIENINSEDGRDDSTIEVSDFSDESSVDEVIASSSSPLITVQPSDQVSQLGKQVSFTVEASGENLSYQWQIDRQNGKGFVNLATTTSWIGTTTNVFRFSAIEARLPYRFRVVVSNSYGQVISNEVKLIIGSAPVITQQPEDQVSELGKQVSFVFEATGEDLSYQWQIDRQNGKGFVNLATSTTWIGTTTNVFKFTAIEARTPYRFRAVVSNAYGEAISDEVKLIIGGAAPVISTQPEDQISKLGNQVSFTVEATGDDLSYQWQIDRQNGKGFVNLATSTTWIGTTTNIFRFTAIEARTPYRFRVIVSNDYGEAISDEVKLVIGGDAPVISTQPEDQISKLGNQVSFTVEATGNDLSYQWQIDRQNGKGFVNLATSTTWIGTTTDIFRFTAIEARTPYRFRVVVSNPYGETISNEVKLVIGGDAPIISAQPEDQISPVSKQVSFVVEATGSDLSYQWQIDRQNGKGFVDLATSSTWIGTTTNVFKFTAIEARVPYRFRVVVSNAYGQTISNEVKLIIGSAPVIVVQPEDQTSELNKQVSFVVEATGDDLSYQWQVDRQNGKGFVDLATSSTWIGTTTNIFKFTAITARTPYRFRVVVSNSYGETISDVVKLIINETIIVDDVTYEKIDSTTVRVKSYAGNSASLSIPETVQGLTVVEIGESAFENNATIVSIDLPDTITIIRKYAFKNCTSLASMS